MLSSSIGFLRVEARVARSSHADKGVVPGDEVGTTPAKDVAMARVGFPSEGLLVAGLSRGMS